MLHFNPQGSCEPRPGSNNIPLHSWGFQSTRLSRASTGYGMDSCSGIRHFNPQGSREPRPSLWVRTAAVHPISIHKALASLDEGFSTRGFPKYNISIHKALASLDPLHLSHMILPGNFNPQGSREPRRLCHPCCIVGRYISIHKALASLDFFS